MNDTHPLVEAEARHQIAERVARAAGPRIPSVPPRHRVVCLRTRLDAFSGTRPVDRSSDAGAVEVRVGAGRSRAALPLVPRAVPLRAVRVLRRRGEAEEAELTDLHARAELDRQGGDVSQLEG